MKIEPKRFYEEIGQIVKKVLQLFYYQKKNEKKRSKMTFEQISIRCRKHYLTAAKFYSDLEMLD